MHVAINLKDFKAVVGHAETANATVTARYTRPCKPLQLEYQYEGVTAEFTVMTRGQADDDVPMSSRATIPRQTPAPIPVSANRPRMTQPSVAPGTQMPPPPPRSRSIRPLNGSSTQENLSQKTNTDRPLASGLSMDFDSLFVPADDDRQWDEMNEEEEPQDILGWDASGTRVCGCPALVKWVHRLNTTSRTSSGHLSAMQSLLSRAVLGPKSQTMKWVFRQLSVCLRYVAFSETTDGH
jgi:cell cycle checkpoint control protein RAD9A